MGVVYKAIQPDLNRIVALKLLLEGQHASESRKHRFEREARSIAKLKHPNIVVVHEVGDYEGQPFFTMDFIDGQPLDNFIEWNGIASTYGRSGEARMTEPSIATSLPILSALT